MKDGDGQTSVHFRGTGNFLACVDRLLPLIRSSSSSSSAASSSSSSSSSSSAPKCLFDPESAICSVNGTFQPKVSSYNSEFYGFSEFYYSSFDILGLKGRYAAKQFVESAKNFCATPWNVSVNRHSLGLYPLADSHRLRSQCLKSAYVYSVLHYGFKFPVPYSGLNNEQKIGGQEIQWTLGALLYKMRFYPLGDQREQQHQMQHFRHYGGGGGGGVAVERIDDDFGHKYSLSKSSHFHERDHFFDRDIPFSQYLLLALILLFLFVIAVLTKRLRRWMFSSSFSSSSSSASLAEYLSRSKGGGGGGLFRFPESMDTPAGQRLRKSSETLNDNLPV